MVTLGYDFLFSLNSTFQFVTLNYTKKKKKKINHFFDGEERFLVREREREKERKRERGKEGKREREKERK